jgi:hypothetical protein
VTTLRGKSLQAVARDIAEGYVMVNPLYLKPLDAESLKALHDTIMKVQVEIRGEKFPFSNVPAIRKRNMMLQRLHTSLMIIKNFVRERRIRDFY